MVILVMVIVIVHDVFCINNYCSAFKKAEKLHRIQILCLLFSYTSSDEKYAQRLDCALLLTYLSGKPFHACSANGAKLFNFSQVTSLFLPLPLQTLVLDFVGAFTS